MDYPVAHIASGRRYFVWLALSFIVGILYGLRFHIDAAFFLSFFKYTLIFLGISLALCLSLSFLLPNHDILRADIILLWFILLSFCLGAFRISYYENIQYRTLKESAGKENTYNGILIGEPMASNTQKTLGFPVKVLSIEKATETIPASGNIMVYAKPELSQALHRGDGISFTGTLTPPNGAPYPGGFSMRSYLYRQGLCFSYYARNLARIDADYTPSLFDKIQRLGYNLQNSITASVDQSFGKTTPESALLKGILIGVCEDFTIEQYDDFANSGLIHITSVSGMHVMFLFNALLFFFRKIRFPKWLIYLISMPVLLIFASIAAFTPSVCRSVIMMLLFILAYLVQKEPDSLTSLSVAAVILLAINPYSLTSYSFILSFVTSLGIVLFSGPLGKLLSRFSTSSSRLSLITKPIFSSISLSLASNIGMTFFSARFFNRLSYGSIIANIILLPLASGVFVIGLLNWPISLVFPNLAQTIANFPLRPMLWLINKIAKIFGHSIFSISMPTPPESTILIYIGLFAILYYWLTSMPAKSHHKGCKE